MPNAEPTPVWLPDFCSRTVLFPVVVIGELLAFVLVLRPGSGMVDPWLDLALTSLFVQWVGLTSTALLCLARSRLQRLGPAAGAVTAWLVVVAVVATLSEVAWWLVATGVWSVSGPDAGVISDTVFWLTQTPWLALDLPAAQHADFLIRTTTIGAIVGAVALRYVQVQYQRAQDVESEARARIAALQARIRPHFLFNSMNTIASFVRTQPAQAEQVVEDLSDLFRASLGADDRHVTLASELELARGYLRIEALRLGDRLAVEWHVDALPDHARLPRLTLQPLVENAVYHGIERLDAGGTIRVDGERVDGEVRIRVTNPVPPSAPVGHGHQLAQRSVAERLAHHFGEHGRFTTQTEDGHYSAEIAFPVAEEP